MSISPFRFTPRRLAQALALVFVGASQSASAITIYPDPFQLAQAEYGFDLLVSQLALSPNGCGFCGGSGGLTISENGNNGFSFFPYQPPFNYSFTPQVNTMFTAGSDADLIGNPVVLVQASLTLTDSFETARNFTIGNPAYPPDYWPITISSQVGNTPAQPAGGIGIIDTAGHTLKITGVVNSYQTLYKNGDGTLWLTGANNWVAAPIVLQGVLKGDAQSLATDIHNFATVEFNQTGDARYSHLIDGGTVVKTGAGTLTFDQAMKNLPVVDIAEGTLALRDGGTLSGRITVEQTGILDLGGDGVAQVLPSLYGNGKVLIGARGLTLDVAYDDVSFGGTISGPGMLTVQNHVMALTGSNHFQGLNVVNTTLSVGQGESLGVGDVMLTNGTLALAPGTTAFQTLHVTVNSSGNSYGAFPWRITKPPGQAGSSMAANSTSSAQAP
jgi:hypothetical protein